MTRRDTRNRSFISPLGLDRAAVSGSASPRMRCTLSQQSFSKLSKSHWHLKSQNNYSIRTEYLPVQQPKSHYCWKTDSNYPFSSGVPYHINYIYPQLTVCCFRKILKILRGKKNFLSSTRLAFVYLTCFNDGIMLFKDFVPFGNTVHFIAQDFYFLYQRHKKKSDWKYYITVLE